MSKSLNILIISPPNFRVCNPYKFNTGSIEQHIYILAKNLSSRGHKITVFATGDAEVPTGVNLKYFYTKVPNNYYALSKKQLQGRDITHSIKALKHIDHKYDYIMSHSMSTIPLFDLLKVNNLKLPCSTTLHWPLNDERLSEFLQRFRHQPIIAISRHQKRALSHNNIIGVVHHGLEIENWPFKSTKQHYLLFIGKLIPEKGPDLAIQAAIKCKIPLVLVGNKIEERYPGYFDTKIKPFLGHGVSWIGEAQGVKKIELLKNARALLGPGRWCEPFGIVFIEAQACGTPVIAWNPHSSNDSIISGTTGFILKAKSESKAVSEMVTAIKKIDLLSSASCRENIVNNFSAANTALEYERIILKETSPQT